MCSGCDLDCLLTEVGMFGIQSPDERVSFLGLRGHGSKGTGAAVSLPSFGATPNLVASSLT